MKNLTLIAAFTIFAFVSACNKSDKTTETTTTSETTTQARNIRSQEAKTLLSEEEAVVILDVRTPQEFSGGHLQKAINLDYNAPGFSEKLDAMDKNKKYLVYCAVGGRSAKTAALMEEKGFARVYNCEEGYDDLKKEGVPAE